jgi:hypothetical protein
MFKNSSFNIIFESDFKIVMDAIQTNHRGVSQLSTIILLINLLLVQCNLNFENKFPKCQANMIIHMLVRAAISWSCRTFFYCVHRCIEPIIILHCWWIFFSQYNFPKMYILFYSCYIFLINS